MKNLYKWLIGILTALVSSLPSWHNISNKGCAGNCSLCATNCLMPLLIIWVLIVACISKLKKSLVAAYGK